MDLEGLNYVLRVQFIKHSAHHLTVLFKRFHRFRSLYNFFFRFSIKSKSILQELFTKLSFINFTFPETGKTFLLEYNSVCLACISIPLFCPFGCSLKSNFYYISRLCQKYTHTTCCQTRSNSYWYIQAMFWRIIWNVIFSLLAFCNKFSIWN